MQAGKARLVRKVLLKHISDYLRSWGEELGCGFVDNLAPDMDKIFLIGVEIMDMMSTCWMEEVTLLPYSSTTLHLGVVN